MKLSRRRGATALAVAVTISTLTLVDSAQASHIDPTVIEQQRELLHTPTSFTGSGTIDIHRGLLPGGTSKFDPAPAGVLNVVAKVTGAVGFGSWVVNVPGTGAVAFDKDDKEFSLRTASFSWPSSDVNLLRIEVTNEGAQGIFDLHRVYLSMTQTGTIKKTVGRVPIAVYEQGLASATWEGLDVLHKYVPDDFDPAPNVRLEAGVDVRTADQGEIILVNTDDNSIAGALLFSRIRPRCVRKHIDGAKWPIRSGSQGPALRSFPA